jgi:thiol-disulfide isomerase/thioredoxin
MISPEIRLLVVVVLAALMTAGVFGARAWNARRIRRLQQQVPDWDLLGHQPDGRRTLIAFSTPSCAACHTAQAPAIDRAAQTLGHEEVRVIKVDAARQPEVARAFGVQTVPSTVILAADGDQIVAVNQGFTPSGRLLEQLHRALNTVRLPRHGSGAVRS